MITVFSIKTDDKKDHVISYRKYEIKQEFRISDVKQEETWHVQGKSGSSWEMKGELDLTPPEIIVNFFSRKKSPRSRDFLNGHK